MLLCLEYTAHPLEGDLMRSSQDWTGACVHGSLFSQTQGEISGSQAAAAAAHVGALEPLEQGRAAKQTRFVQAIYFVLG